MTSHYWSVPDLLVNSAGNDLTSNNSDHVQFFLYQGLEY